MKKYNIENLPVIHKYDNRHPIVALKLFIRVGSFYEPKEKSGLTNLLQDVIIKGTKNRTAEDIFIELESLGGSISSDANDDFSTITVSLPSKNFKKGVEILFDVVLNPTFPEEEIEKERTSILAELKQRKDYIFNVAYDTLLENIYGEHPYARLTLGTEETVKKLTRDDIVFWYKEVYGNPNFLLVIVGDVPMKIVDTEIKKYAHLISERKPTEIKKIDFKPIKPYVNIKSEKFKQSYLMIGFVAPMVSSDDYVPMKMLNAYLAGGMGSPLFHVIREDVGFAYETHAFYPSNLDKSHFVIYAGLDEKNIPEAKKRIQVLLDKLKSGEIDEKRFNETKKYIKGTYLLGKQTYASQAHLLGWWEVLGRGYMYDEEYIKDLEKQKLEQMKEVTIKYLNNPVIVEIVPKK